MNSVRLSSPKIWNLPQIRAISQTSASMGQHDCKMWKNTEPNLPNWRKKAGLSQNPNAFGPLTNLPDYTFMDGRPTPLGARMKVRVMRQRKWAAEIVEKLGEIDFAKQRYQELQKQKEEERKAILSYKLKPKGPELLKK